MIVLTNDYVNVKSTKRILKTLEIKDKKTQARQVKKKGRERAARC